MINTLDYVQIYNNDIHNVKLNVRRSVMLSFGK
jgi:hypothetical protein